MAISEKTKLKQIVRSLIVAQGNVFIKELLRGKQKSGADVTIGSTKAEFEKNLVAAIDNDVVTADDIENWLALTEGWGAQHIYLFRAPKSQRKESIEASILASRYKALLAPSKKVVFPAKLKLTSIVVDSEKLALTWHRGSSRFSRAKTKDTELVEGLDRYELRAYLEHRDRAVVRFEWLFGREYCALFVQLAFNDPDHHTVFRELWRALTSIGVVKKPSEPVPLVNAVRNLGEVADSVERSSKWTTSGGYVDLYANADGGIAAVGPIARARRGINVKEFSSAEGQFELPTLDPVPGEAKKLRLSVYGAQGRVRIASQCLRKQVYEVVEEIWRQNA